MLCVSLHGDYKFINCLVNATQFHVAGLPKVSTEDYLALNGERVAIQEERFRISLHLSVMHFDLRTCAVRVSFSDSTNWQGRGKSSQCFF